MSEIPKIYEDEHLMVFDKPSGLIVNRSQTTSDTTLQDIIEPVTLSGDSVEDPENEFINRTGIVHRLDKDTSGIILIAKDEETFQALQAQFKNREVEKEYIALVTGRVTEDKIEINAPLKRNPKSKFKFAVVRGGKEAVTHIQKIKEVMIEDSPFTLLKVMPKTGRTHQIRVHLSALGHPIVNDEIYAPSNLNKKWSGHFPRMMLHAHRLTITHPATGELKTFESELPSEFLI